ncbi:thermonuclease family protein [Pararhodospirillum oryzae]|uniref:Nuclease n=1 Tax=Pararhodospirillum oryzae TaxID=478448 RepID=A0A512HAC1_9PROT|nr:thermonuclease family protein [Pararhodospirillum oryzae]GEO82403.1 nuclease [Pararhodospirillum oryzae]
MRKGYITPRLWWVGVGLIALGGAGTVSLPAEAQQPEVSGPACVTDAGHLVINGKRSYGACQGGTPVVLANIDAPGIAQTCQAPSGQTWPCGRWAAYFLLELTKNKTIRCLGEEKDANGGLIAVCLVERMEINHALVSMGWALPANATIRYHDAMEEAREKRAGLWQGTFDRPSDWNARHGKDK